MMVVSLNSYYSSKIILKIQVILKKYSPNFTTRRVKTTKSLYMNIFHFWNILSLIISFLFTYFLKKKEIIYIIYITKKEKIHCISRQSEFYITHNINLEQPKINIEPQIDFTLSGVFISPA